MQSRDIDCPNNNNIAGFGAYKLIIAEDDEDVRDALAQLFVRDGFEVTQVANGTLLVQTLENTEHLPDMLIMDHRMPGFSGLEILNLLQLNIPVIMMTAFGMEVFEAARSSGVCAVFEKPFNFDDLKTAVCFYLDEAQRRAVTAIMDVQPPRQEMRDTDFRQALAAEIRSWRFPPKVQEPEP